ncbi:woronin body major protein [Lasallia pustulata]|uniref:Woronin body major protein n=1 Tax=Lasallia pustulata TaxID=136370 RepID=A0A1W5CW72_9LECA|nr:woronin body major protein [Lasallia pustulata]
MKPSRNDWLYRDAVKPVALDLLFKRHSRRDAFKVVNLDFDGKVPIPFSVFPSSYRSDAAIETTRTRVEGEVNLPPGASRVGREGHETRYSSFSANLPGRRRDQTRYEEEEINIRESDRTNRPRRREDVTVYEEERPERFAEVELSRERYREPYQRYPETKVDIEVDRQTAGIDTAERDYRRRFQPTYDVEYERVRSGPREEVKTEAETTVDPPKRDMGYYDDEGHYHSFRRGLERAADRVMHPFHPHHHTDREEIIIDREEDRGPTRIRDGVRESVRFVERGVAPNTITIPCHHIRVGDLLVLQGRPCQVIRITTSAQTGQHRYLGVDLFTKQLHEESSFVSNPQPSVIVQNMLGPVFKQYRVLDIRDDGRVVAMTESGEVKQGLPVIDQGGLWSRLNESFANGRGSVRVLVINDGGRELAVDYKVIHGSRL